MSDMSTEVVDPHTASRQLVQTDKQHETIRLTHQLEPSGAAAIKHCTHLLTQLCFLVILCTFLPLVGLLLLAFVLLLIILGSLARLRYSHAATGRAQMHRPSLGGIIHNQIPD